MGDNNVTLNKRINKIKLINRMQGQIYIINNFLP